MLEQRRDDSRSAVRKTRGAEVFTEELEQSAHFRVAQGATHQATTQIRNELSSAVGSFGATASDALQARGVGNEPIGNDVARVEIPLHMQVGEAQRAGLIVETERLLVARKQIFSR